ncbi:MAG: FAD-dependent oxidoreductase [Candidatus Muproteobacteria bacterium RBG_16_60_9]|uniref:FAD-dependent oxidoreductase n=1 Tax=Candidatus Muproteobacteria bacterium RBG_16_60_9 TaxID=1817755 RepID=A0A1F6VJI3_9PROT|nr:MAG: FAD-dependent oxidoreductase [Candidatus Muproteobacteria bacterium RBG_16_60_9]
MKIAIVGTGIAGNVAAYHLTREHDITVFEAESHIGGHSHTHDVEQDGNRYAIDTGFIVFNDWTYPRFIELLTDLGVDALDSEMSFSVKCAGTGLEYNGTSLNSLFAQRRNLFRPSFWRMLRDIMRFNREAPALLAPDAPDVTLGRYLRANRYSRQFVEQYLIPMGAAIWSAAPETMRQFPARYFVRFFHNHGMLSVADRPTWRVIRGGSARYVEKLTARFHDRIRRNTPVETIRRQPTHVLVKARGHEPEHFDAVFIACHSDQALRLLADPTAPERQVLGAIPYQPNEVVLHTDTSVLPRRRLAWAAWNYHIPRLPQDRVAVTYNMNILQRLLSRTPFLVTLNMTHAIDPAKIIKRLSYQHPMFTPAGVAAQQRQGEINGAERTYYCGAYWRNGFHEDGVVSALNAINHFQRRTQNAERHLYRVG